MIRFLQTPGTAKKVFLTAVLLFIAAMMVISLIPGGILGEVRGAGAGVLARVGDQEVTVYEVEQRAQQVRQQRNVPAQFMAFVRQQVADSLVLDKAMVVEAHRLGLQVTDDELRDELRNGAFGPELFPNGQFVGQEAYENWVSQRTRMGLKQFEAVVKQQILLNKLRSVVADGVRVSPQELEQEYKRQNTQVKLEYAVVTPEAVMSEIRPTEQELKAYYDRNKDSRYRDSVPERRRAKYVVVDTGRLAQQVQAGREDIQRYYNENKEQYRRQEEVNVRHILVKTPPPGPDGKPDAAAVEAARKKADDLLKQVKAGGDFAALAKKNSDDPGSKDNGGSYGWVGRGRFVPEFEKVAFSLQPGQVSDHLVQTTFGFHIIKVDDKHSAELQPLEQVRAQIEPVVRQQKAARQAENLASSLQSQARTQGVELAAAKNNLQVIQSELFSRTDALPGLGLAPQFMDAVFSASEKSSPGLVTVPQGFVLYQVTEVKPAATPSFAEIRARVETEFKQERTATLVQQRTRELSDRARAQHDLKKAARELGLSTRTSELVGPNSQVPELGPLTGDAAVAFAMMPGEISQPIAVGDNGTVLTVLQRNEPSMEGFERAKDRLRESLLQTRRTVVLRLFAESLRDRMQKEGKIRFNKDEQQRIFNSRADTAGS